MLTSLKRMLRVLPYRELLPRGATTFGGLSTGKAQGAERTMIFFWKYSLDNVERHAQDYPIPIILMLWLGMGVTVGVINARVA